MPDPSESSTPAAPERMGFRELGLPAPLLSAVDDLGFTQCTPIQQEVLPHTLLGNDCIGKAQTGTGKTAAFLLTILSDLIATPAEEPRYAGEPRALVIAPTRELAMQIGKDAADLAKYTPFHIVTLIGGVWRTMRRTWGMNPMSSMRSASSITSSSTRSRWTSRWLWKSISLPGVATRMSTSLRCSSMRWRS